MSYSRTHMKSGFILYQELLIHKCGLMASINRVIVNEIIKDHKLEVLQMMKILISFNYSSLISSKILNVC